MLLSPGTGLAGKPVPHKKYGPEGRIIPNKNISSFLGLHRQIIPGYSVIDGG